MRWKLVCLHLSEVLGLSSLPMAKLRIGVVADVQHADKDDKGCDGRVRYYRAAPDKLAQAVDAFNEARVDCVVTLGDAIDGNEDEESTLRDLERVVTQFERITMPTYHVLGNHCLSLPRDTFQDRIGMKASYYTARLADGWLLIVCDTNDLSTYGWPQGHPKYLESEKFLLDHDGPQMQPWNGGMSDQQLVWLTDILDRAHADGDAVILAAHHPLNEQAARPSHCAWNWEQISQKLCEYQSLKLVLAGHDHVGGYAVKGHIHFVTLEAILETPSTAHAIIHVYDDRFEVVGTGIATSRTLAYHSD